ncbi:Pimeloyl-ACP methyl ester carboxylesterase [Actinacidiphila yanglinensis]|uniref:Pimeloyl-ACP methyl ester carboxylesterase n=1 Tax=Actinacidiphila yanglinensis TaxID=310779 RepID=A0A1H6CA32_9ACTN|nr:alpha/beta hydrolase [Actinacidiphila yanglinensis]SEG69820.1 Pimeloyl-ACP methyl ester carboxylesterase [Actinacidiphila yanglinensis]
MATGTADGEHTVELSAGTLAYGDTGGDGPVLVLLHGLAQNGSVWRKVVDELRTDHRCLTPTLPEGGHRIPMRPEADLSPRAVAALAAEFMDRLDLRDVTLAEVDSGRAQQVAAFHGERIARLVLVACEAFENYPPGLPGKMITLAARVPGALHPAVRIMAARPLRRSTAGLGVLSKYPVPDEVVDGWMRPLLTDPAIRADLRRYLLGVRHGEMAEAAEELRRFDRPALVVWATEDRMMPAAHGRRLAELLPRGRLLEVADSRTLVPEDQPGLLAGVLRDFVATTG